MVPEITNQVEINAISCINLDMLVGGLGIEPEPHDCFGTTLLEHREPWLIKFGNQFTLSGCIDITIRFDLPGG